MTIKLTIPEQTFIIEGEAPSSRIKFTIETVDDTAIPVSVPVVEPEVLPETAPEVAIQDAVVEPVAPVEATSTESVVTPTE